MALPLTLAIVVLALVIALLSYLLWKILGEMRATNTAALTAMSEMSAAATRSSELAAKNLPKQTDAMISTLASAVTQVAGAVSGSVQAIHGPAQAIRDADAGHMPDLPTPWYAHPGAMDYGDPTDSLMNEGMTDPSIGQAAGNLILDGEDEPFGIPGLKVGM